MAVRRKTATSGKRGRKVIAKARPKDPAVKAGQPRHTVELPRKAPPELLLKRELSPAEFERWKEGLSRYIIESHRGGPGLIGVRVGVPHRLDERREFEKSLGQRKRKE
jgi:hypothetical protein